MVTDDDMAIPGWMQTIGLQDGDAINSAYLGQVLKSSLFTEGFDMSRLTHMFLKKNHLSALPAEIGLCVNLEILDISENQIDALPVEFKSLANLVELNIAENAHASQLPTKTQRGGAPLVHVLV